MSISAVLVPCCLPVLGALSSGMDVSFLEQTEQHLMLWVLPEWLASSRGPSEVQLHKVHFTAPRHLWCNSGASLGTHLPVTATWGQPPTTILRGIQAPTKNKTKKQQETGFATTQGRTPGHLQENPEGTSALQQPKTRYCLETFIEATQTIGGFWEKHELTQTGQPYPPKHWAQASPGSEGKAGSGLTSQAASPPPGSLGHAGALCLGQQKLPGDAGCESCMG